MKTITVRKQDFFRALSYTEFVRTLTELRSILSEVTIDFMVSHVEGRLYKEQVLIVTFSYDMEIEVEEETEEVLQDV